MTKEVKYNITIDILLAALETIYIIVILYILT